MAQLRRPIRIDGSVTADAPIDKLLRYGLHVAVASGRLRYDQQGRLTLA
ncbi:hypothetical protein ABZ388_27260 [Micromonospora parva]